MLLSRVNDGALVAVRGARRLERAADLRAEFRRVEGERVVLARDF